MALRNFTSASRDRRFGFTIFISPKAPAANEESHLATTHFECPSDPNSYETDGNCNDFGVQGGG